MKRCIGLLLLLCAFLLASCAGGVGQGTPFGGAGANRGDEITLRFACMDYERDHYQSLADRFEVSYPGIHIELVSVDEITGNAPGVTNSDDVLKVARAADTFGWYGGAIDWVNPADAFLDLSELAANDEQLDVEDFFPGVLALFHQGDKLWGLPYKAQATLLYYDPAKFDQVGLPYPQVGWTWDDLLEAATRLTIREGDEVTQWGYLDPWPSRGLMQLARQKAGQLVDWEAVPPQVHLDQPAVAEALRWYADLIQVHRGLPNPLEVDYQAQSTLMHESTPAMWMDGSWYLDQYQRTRDACVAPLPEAGQPGTEVSAYAYFISSGTAHPQAVWQWIAWLSEQPPSRLSGGIPSSIPTRRSVAEETGYWEEVGDETANVLRYCLEHATVYPSALYGALQRALIDVLQGTSVEEALALAQARAGEQLATQAMTVAQGATEAFRVPTSQPTPSAEGTVIRFLAPPGADLAAYRSLAERFAEEHPGIIVDIAPASYGNPDELAGAADCFGTYAGLLPPDASLSSLLALDPFADSDPSALEGIHPAFLREVQRDQKLWGLPLETDASLLYYNRDLFDAAAASYPDATWTPQQFVQQALALTGGATYGYSPRQASYWEVPLYLAWLGGQLYNTDRYPTFDDSSMIEALTHLAALIGQAAPPNILGEPPDRGQPATVTSGLHPLGVADGRVALWDDRYGNHLIAPRLDFTVGVAPLPEGAISLDEGMARALFISAKTEQPEACWEWIRFVSAQPEAISLLPVRWDVPDSAIWRARVGEAAADAWAATLARELPSSPWAIDPQDYSYTWLDRALADVLAGAHPSAALAQAQARAAAYADCRARGEEWRICAEKVDPSVALPAK